MKQHVIQIDAEKCIGCGLCERDCAAGNIAIQEKKAVLRGQDCIKCGHCVAICPKGAVSMTGYSEPPEELAAEPGPNPEQLLLAIKARRSIRQFQAREIPEEIIHRILEAGRYTPTAKNLQNVSYLVLKNEAGRFEMTAVAFFRKLLPLAGLMERQARHMTIDDHFFLKKAPVAIVVVSNGGFAQVNGALAASNMALMAEASGLGVLYSGFFALAANYCGKLRKQLGLQRGEKVVTTLVLGYPGVAYRRTAQRDDAVIQTM